MKREIKFRAWNVNHMISPEAIMDVSSEICMGDLNAGLWTFMQFTGLLDKNGKEIYEGDIICFVEDVVVENIGGYPRTEPEGKFREVAWNQLHCAWGLFQNGGQSEDMLADWINEDGSTPKQWECKELEIIGNIYENPELLPPTDSTR